MAEKIDETILDVQIAMARNTIIDMIPPVRLRTFIQSLEALEIDKEEKDEALAKVLEFIASLIAQSLQGKAGSMQPMVILELCNLWSMHFRKLLPPYAYEEESRWK